MGGLEAWRVWGIVVLIAKYELVCFHIGIAYQLIVSGRIAAKGNGSESPG
jgi:hypothetical protein